MYTPSVAVCKASVSFARVVRVPSVARATRVAGVVRYARVVRVACMAASFSFAIYTPHNYKHFRVANRLIRR